MRRRKVCLSIGISFMVFCGAVLSCVTDKAPLQQNENIVPQSEIAYYNDSFDKMREDLWDRAGYLHKEEQMQNFKQADMRFDNGKLIIRTKTGSFSKGGLGAKYALRGDFDIQLDCRIDFLKGASGMEQLLYILVIDKSGEIGKANTVLINLTMGDGLHQGWLKSRGFINGSWENSSAKNMENFDGALRILRKGKEISTLYKKKGVSAWSTMHTFRATDKDMMFGFQLSNYFVNRTVIRAKHSISAEFDNFRINAVQEIIEEEI
ncbi:MAG TPA: hypothetical protein HPQ03_13575 [Deltaproteobacteria bacterium]|nr:hypothetical protein [Deltaproteobacteria bacterium]